MPGRARRRTAALLGLAAAASLALMPRAEAASGRWGAGHYAYADGTVCRSGPITAPLAAWVVAGGHRAYLTHEVSSNGRFDSAAPPVPGAGQPVAPIDVAPGGEFGSQQDVAAVAYLLSHGGDATTLAAAVLAQTDPGGLPSCTDRSAAYTALAEARNAAGPYQVTVTSPATKARPGTAVEIAAKVVTSTGNAVKGVAVRFAAPGARFATPSATTDSTGVARDAMTLRSGSAGSVAVTASTLASVGLLEATVTATASPTNPSGAAVPAVYPAPATAFTGQLALDVDQAAHPVVSSALATHLFRQQAPVTPRAKVSGLFGHRAVVSFDFYGPLPLHDGSLCAGIPPSRWRAAQAGGHSQVSVTGDGTVVGGDVSPQKAGCYAMRIRVATVDATPAAVRTAPLTVLAVLDTALREGDDHPAVLTSTAAATGQLTSDVQLTDTHGLRSTMLLRLTGPIRPLDGDCGATAKAWSKAPKRTQPANVHPSGSQRNGIDGPGSYRYGLAAPTEVGCYQARPILRLSAAGGEHLDVAADSAEPVYVLDPQITATVGRTWTVSPAAVPVEVEVDGLYGLAAHVSTAMYVTSPPPSGCAQANFTGARKVDTGPSADVPAQPGPVTVSVQSGPTPKLGCYAVVPVLTLDADPRVHVAGSTGANAATLIAGVDPDHPVKQTAKHGGSSSVLEFLVAIGVLGLVLLAIIARIAFVAWRERDGSPEESWAGLRDSADPFDLTGGELPSHL